MEENQEIRIEFRETVSLREQANIVELYQTAGWWEDSYDPSGIPALVKGSFAFVVAQVGEDGQLIGMARVISDGNSDAYIQDVVVHRGFREKGIGRLLIKALRDFCLDQGIVWLGLIAEPGTEAFYTPLGFEVMKAHLPMRFTLEKEDPDALS